MHVGKGTVHIRNVNQPQLTHRMDYDDLGAHSSLDQFLNFKVTPEAPDYDHLVKTIQRSSDKRLSHHELRFKFFGSPNKTENEPTKQINHCKDFLQDESSIYELSKIINSTVVEDDILSTHMYIAQIHQSAIAVKLSAGVEPTSCMVKGVNQSAIFLGFNGSILLENVENLIFFINCNQLRMKNAKNCIVIANVISQCVIVEACCNLKFGSSLKDDTVKEPTYEVNDLNWPKRDERNPHVLGLDRQYSSVASLIKTHFKLDLKTILELKFSAIKSSCVSHI